MCVCVSVFVFGLTRYPARSNALCTLTGTIGRPSASSLALRLRSFGALVFFALGARLQICATLALSYLGPYPSFLHVVG